MRHKLLLGFLLAAILALCSGGPTYGRQWLMLPCDTLLELSSACNLRGPVHTVELWSDHGSLPSSVHRVLTFSPEGVMIEREVWTKGTLQVRDQYSEDGAGAKRVSYWTDNGQEHNSEDVISLNQRRDPIRDENRSDGVLTYTEQYEYDSAGRQILKLNCPAGAEPCYGTRLETKYDEQGRLMLARQVEIASGQVTSRLEYEYPGENRKRELDFEGCDRDPKAPASIPMYLIETTYDAAGRIIEETTTSPVLEWEKENTAPGAPLTLCSEGPQPDHVVKQYDDRGRLVSETREGWGGTQSSNSYTYDGFGNQLSWHTMETRPECENTECGETGITDIRGEFSYKYDRFGNWTSKASYTLNKDGRRGKPFSIEYQKLTYYPQ